MSREVVACSGMNTRAGSHSSPEVHTAPQRDAHSSPEGHTQLLRGAHSSPKGHTAPQRDAHSSPEGPDSQREGSYFLFMLFLTCVSSIDI